MARADNSPRNDRDSGKRGVYRRLLGADEAAAAHDVCLT
jgi:hypothetical protein